MITREDLAKLAPRALPDYVESLTSADGTAVLKHFGILENLNRLCGFMGNVLHETGALTIKSESLRYRSPQRLREVWPRRFGSKSDGELAHLIGNELELASAVYNGRMGNRPGTHDGYYFRGKGHLQVTGRESYAELAHLCGIDIDANPEATEHMAVMLRLSCAEWYKSGCNDLMDRGDYLGACARINVGNDSAKARAAVVGMPDRNLWLSKCLNHWRGDPDVLETPAALLVDINLDGEADLIPGQESHWADAGDDDHASAA